MSEQKKFCILNVTVCKDYPEMKGLDISSVDVQRAAQKRLDSLRDEHGLPGDSAPQKADKNPRQER